MRLSNAQVIIFCDFQCSEFIFISNALFQLQRAKLRPLMPTSLIPRLRSSTNQSKCVAARQTWRWPTWPAAKAQVASVSARPLALLSVWAKCARRILTTATSVLNQRSGKEENQEHAKRASPLRNSGSVLPPVGLRKNLLAAFILCVTKRGQNTATTPITSQAFHFSSILIILNSRKLLPQTWQHSQWRVELPDPRVASSWCNFLGWKCQHLPRYWKENLFKLI